jgi:hypothetical protein
MGYGPDMDRETLKDHLAQAEDHLATGERIIAQQKALVAELARDGHDTFGAMRLLIQFEETLTIRITDRNRLRAELAKVPPA